MAARETNNTDLARAEILWKSADALRGQIDAAEYKHVVLGLLFLGTQATDETARRCKTGSNALGPSAPRPSSDTP